jgi:predicted dehydrogenase
MADKTVKAILLGAGQRGNAYCEYALSHPDRLQIVGVAEPDPTRRNDFQKKHGISDLDCLSTWEKVFLREKWADAVIICTQDTMHYGPAMAAIAQGYDILLEKPISPGPKECMEIARAARAKGVKVVVCHVLRYAPFFSKIKEIIDSGEIGDVVTVVHNENVGDLHHAHSFVRGNWGIGKESSPMILAKSCHDMDIMQWLIGKDVLRLSSFGSLSYFTKANCPKEAPPRCTNGCEVDCPYDSRKLYLNSDNEWFRSVAVGHYNATDEEVEAALKTGPYGRCVYQCDNDVVDHQVVSMEFEDGVTAIFSMSSFTPDISRSIKIMGTRGQIRGHSGPESIKVFNFIDRSEREILVGSRGGHGGGDAGIMEAFCAYLTGKSLDNTISEANISAQNHMLCFAAEKSRLQGGAIVEMKAFVEGV